MSLQGAIEWIQDLAISLGVSADDYVSETASEELMWSVCYVSSGEITTAADGWGRDFDNITVQILTQRNDLTEAMKRLKGFPHNLARLIQDDTTMDGNVTTYESITYQFITMEWSGVICVGYDITINRVKTLTTH